MNEWTSMHAHYYNCNFILMIMHYYNCNSIIIWVCTLINTVLTLIETIVETSSELDICKFKLCHGDVKLISILLLKILTADLLAWR